MLPICSGIKRIRFTDVVGNCVATEVALHILTVKERIKIIRGAPTKLHPRILFASKSYDGSYQLFGPLAIEGSPMSRTRVVGAIESGMPSLSRMHSMTSSATLSSPTATW